MTDPMPFRGGFCEEKIRLVADYCAAVSAYSLSIAELEQGLITRSRETYAERYKRSETARHLAETARKELEDHVSDHGC